MVVQALVRMEHRERSPFEAGLVLYGLERKSALPVS